MTLPETLEDLANDLAEYHRLARERQRLEDAQKPIRERVEGYLKAHGVDRAEAGGYQVTWSLQERASISVTEAKVLLTAEQLSRLLKPSTYPVLRVTRLD